MGGAGNGLISGGADADTFVFAPGCGMDTVVGFEDDVDTLVFNAALWTGTRTVQQVLDDFASQLSPGTILFDFGSGDTVRVTRGGGIDVADLLDDVVIDSTIV